MTLALILSLLISQSSVEVNEDGTIKLKSGDSQLVITGALEGAITDSNANLKQRCDGKSPVKIMGNSNHVVLSGDCNTVWVMGNHNTVVIARAKSVEMSGNHNEVHVEAVGTIRLPGNKNTLRWKRGLKGGQTPRISNTGHENRAVQDGAVQDDDE